MRRRNETAQRSDRDALAEVLHGDIGDVLDLDVCEAAAETILASDWLAERDRRIKAEALREAADVMPLRVMGAVGSRLPHRWLCDRADRIEGKS